MLVGTAPMQCPPYDSGPLPSDRLTPRPHVSALTERDGASLAPAQAAGLKRIFALTISKCAFPLLIAGVLGKYPWRSRQTPLCAWSLYSGTPSVCLQVVPGVHSLALQNLDLVSREAKPVR